MFIRTLSTGALVVLLGASSACTDAAQTLLIVQNQIPGAGCSLSNTTGSNFYAKGVIDLASTSGYILTPLIQNLGSSPAVNDDNTRIAFIEGYDVDLKSADGSLIANGSFSSLAAAAVFPGSSVAMTIEVLPNELLSSQVGNTIVAEVTMFGKIDGGDVESNTFAYPIEVCSGCLQVDVGSCVDLATGFSPRTGGECNPYQDVATDCCTGSDNSLVCPAEKEEVPL